MAERPIICVGDTTTHGGTVLEGFANFSVYGRLASGKGHKVRCPRCKGIFVVVEGAENRTVGDVPLALEGMLTSCGAALVASQRAATAETGSTAAQAMPLSAGSSSITTSEVREPEDGPDQILEQWFAMEDAEGNPVSGYKYDLFRDSAGYAYAVHLSDGETVKVAGTHELRTTVWLVHDSAERT